MIVKYSKRDENRRIEGQIFITGYLFYEEQCFVQGLLNEKQTASLIALVKQVILKQLSPKEFSGSFSIIYQNATQMTILTDRVGSKRVYYYDSDGLFICSDDFFELRQYLKQQNKVLTRDNTALAEIFCFLYAFNDRTILKEIKEVNAATCMEVTAQQVKQECYWRWREKEVTRSYTEALITTDESLNLVQKELTTLLDVTGFTPYLTFSGGGDSRLVISLLLQQLAESKLYTIILGQLASHDVRMAFRIAKELKASILYSPILDYDEFSQLNKYEEQLMKHTRGSNIIGGNIISLLQAKRNLKNGIHLNGHIGDFLGGSHISLKEWLLYLRGNHNCDEFIFRVFRKHAIFHTEKMKKDLSDTIKHDLYLYFKSHPAQNNLDITESFDLEHRQRKYIINDNQSFSSVGLLPSIVLAQKDFIEVFSSMNNEYRYGSRLYNHLKYKRFKKLGKPFTYEYGDSHQGPLLPLNTMLKQVFSDLVKMTSHKIRAKIGFKRRPNIPQPLDGKVYYYGLDGYFEIREEYYIRELQEVGCEMFNDIGESMIISYSTLPNVIPQMKYLQSLD
jgi:hypothetical protein